MICDFCNAPNPVWRFRARPFLIDYGPITGESDADWAACNACREMIVADDRNGLVDRAMLMAPLFRTCLRRTYENCGGGRRGYSSLTAYLARRRQLHS